MPTKKFIDLDYETLPIEGRHIAYPPKAVGAAISGPGIRKRYYAWGHPTKNNCTKQDFHDIISKVYNGNVPLRGHNLAKFDCEVTEAEFDLPLIPPCGLEDTLPLYFIYNPHARKLALKELAEKELQMAATEQQELFDWIRANIEGVNKNTTNLGAYIGYAPGDIVGRYAKKDIGMSGALYEHIAPKLDEQEWAAYRREIELAPVLVEMEREGVYVDLERLETTLVASEKAIVNADKWIFKQLGGEINLNAGQQLAKAIFDQGMGAPDTWPTTAKSGGYKTDRAALAEHCTNPHLISALEYRGKMMKCVGTYVKPWLEMARASGGRIFTQWFASANEQGGGARTGRFSSKPNFQNIPGDPTPVTSMRNAFIGALALPEDLYKIVCEIPPLRDYVLSDPGQSLIDRDYSQQELRVLAHFEEGAAFDAYMQDPDLDFHDMATELVNTATGLGLSRKQVKTIVFGLCYGMGAGKLAGDLGVSMQEARTLKKAVLGALPGLKSLDDDCKQIGKDGGKIRTWGGRRYAVEPPKRIDGEYRTFEYKLLNVLIQGSGADITKQAILNYNQSRKNGRLLLSVHDELLVTTSGDWKEEMSILKEAMESVPLEIPLKTDGKADGRSWASLKASA